jgi:pyruvate kinase
MRKTKIICTLGPASSSEEVMRDMILAGMDVARCNMSHGTQEDHAKRIAMVRKVSKDLNRSVGIMLDTKGPEVRIRTFKDGKVTIKTGQDFTFTTDIVEGDENIVSVNYANLPNDMKPGDIIMVNDGLTRFEVKQVNGNNINCKCIEGGTLSNQKSCNFPNKVLSMPYISEADKKDLQFGCEQKVDYIAASFVSNRENVLELREFIKNYGGEDIEVISKIENSSGVTKIDEIYDVSDGVMVARGDMGVEISFAELPGIQRMMIEKAKTTGKYVIVATEMLESMIAHPRPTRAETNDVATAIYEGTSVIMLSGETAAGKYPVLCVQTMSDIAKEAECHIDYFQELKDLNFTISRDSEAVCYAASNAASSINASLIVAFTKGGKTAKLMSRFRPGVPIVGATENQNTYTQLALGWGVIPELVEHIEEPYQFDIVAGRIARKYGCKKDDSVVLTMGFPLEKETNIMKIIHIE